MCLAGRRTVFFDARLYRRDRIMAIDQPKTSELFPSSARYLIPMTDIARKIMNGIEITTAL